MKKVIVIAFLLGALTGKAEDISVDTLRYLYFEEWVGKCGAEKLVGYTETIGDDANPVFKAYRGAGLATTSNCTSWPLQKISRFRDGKALIEESVSHAPENLEVRFLRYTIQKNIPSFLGYDNLEEDREFIMERLTLQLKNGHKDELVRRILEYLYETRELTDKQIKDLENAVVNE